MKGGPHGGGWRPQRLGQGPREDPELFFFFFAEAHVGSVPQVNDLCGLPAGAATCSGEAPHALLFDTARGASLRTSWPPSFSTLPLSGTMRGSTLPMRASGRGMMSVHACACTPQGVLCCACLLAPAHPCGTHDRFLPSRSPFEPRQSGPPSLQQGAQDVMITMRGFVTNSLAKSYLLNFSSPCTKY